MGMAGLWIAKPKGFSEFDDLCNDDEKRKDADDLIKNGELWTEIRQKLIVDKSTDRSSRENRRNRHIDKDWYNQDEEGWWPVDPVEEIRTEALNQIIRRLEAKDKPKKHVSSYWMCPGGVTSFRIAICESEAQLTVIVLSPPEGPSLPEESDSPHRKEYLTTVQQLDDATTDQAKRVGQSANTLKIETRTFDDAKALASRYSPGRRVIIRRKDKPNFYRTILESTAKEGNNVESHGVVIKVRAGSGSGAAVFDTESVGIALIERRRPPTFPELYDLGENILLISGVDLVPTTNTKPVLGEVIGAAVRKIIDPEQEPREEQPVSVS